MRAPGRSAEWLLSSFPEAGQTDLSGDFSGAVWAGLVRKGIPLANGACAKERLPPAAVRMDSGKRIHGGFFEKPVIFASANHPPAPWKVPLLGLAHFRSFSHKIQPRLVRKGFRPDLPAKAFSAVIRRFSTSRNAPENPARHPDQEFFRCARDQSRK